VVSPPTTLSKLENGCSATCPFRKSTEQIQETRFRQGSFEMGLLFSSRRQPTQGCSHVVTTTILQSDSSLAATSLPPLSAGYLSTTPSFAHPVPACYFIVGNVVQSQGRPHSIVFHPLPSAELLCLLAIGMLFCLDKTSCILHQLRLFLRALMWFRYVVGVSGVLSIRFKDRSSISIVTSSADPLPSTRTKETIQCPSPYPQLLRTHPFQPLDMAEGFQCSPV